MSTLGNLRAAWWHYRLTLKVEPHRRRCLACHWGAVLAAAHWFKCWQRGDLARSKP